MIKIQAIESPQGVLINILGGSYNTNYYYNGKQAEPTFTNDWYKIDKPVKTLTKSVAGQRNSKGFELIDKSFAREDVPLTLSREEAIKRYDSNYGDTWHIKYAHLSSLYKELFETTPATFEPVEFEYECIYKLDKLPVQTDFKKLDELSGVAWSGRVTGNVKNQVLDTIIFPAPLLVERPCQLTSQVTYNIIRSFIKSNIDPLWAKITSDYDFCFSVEKLVHLDEIQEYQVDINNTMWNKRKRKPKYETRYQKTRSVKIFEMTPKVYNSYPIIEGFKGVSHEDLKSNIETYLNDLITEINKPLIDCSCCKGLGVTGLTKIETNKL